MFTQQYPNYWMNSYQQYQQPIYPNQQIQQFQQMNQQISPQPQNPGLSARIVDDFNAITANDVPMDGNGAVFIKRDGSEIQLRNWTAQGTIARSVFKPVKTEYPIENTNAAEKAGNRVNEDVVVALDNINKRFDQLEKSINSLVKQEVPTDE